MFSNLFQPIALAYFLDAGRIVPVNIEKYKKSFTNSLQIFTNVFTLIMQLSEAGLISPH